MAKLNSEQATTFAKDLKSYIGDTTEECSCEVNVVDGGNGASGIEVVPGTMNTSGSIYHMEEVVDFCRGRHLNFWVGARDSGGYPYAFVHIY